jgi:hypothetical protein
MTFSIPARRDPLAPIAEARRPGVSPLKLGPFRRDKHFREDMFVYRRFLLHTALKLGNNRDPVPWLMDYDAPQEIVAKYEEKYQQWLDGIPGELEEKPFLMISTDAMSDDFLKIANDAALVRDLQRDRS